MSAPSSAASTPWNRGRFDARASSKRVLFGHMYEDVAVEARAFASLGRLFCIASAGDTAFALAAHHPIVAVDINPVQLAYAEARLQGAPAKDGAAEHLMAFGRAVLPLAGWRRSRVEEFLSFDAVEAQLAYWHAHLDTRRFRAGMGLLLSVTGLGRVYASPFLRVLPPHFGAVMRGRLERCFARHPNAQNPYARALLLGEYAPAPKPRHPMELVCADAAAYLESLPAGSFDGFTLSNILDGTSATYRGRLLAAVRRAASPTARLVLRSFAEPTAVDSNLAAEDRSMLWGSVAVLDVHGSPLPV